MQIESLQARVAEIVTLKLRHAEVTVHMEAELAAVQKRYQHGLAEMAAGIETLETTIHAYCQKHRAELFPDKKSLDLLLAEIGFELTPWRVEKRSRKDTFPKIAARLAHLPWAAPYLRHPDPELDKPALLADRTTLTPDQLAEAGLKFDQDENFYIRPKSQIADPTTLPAT